MSKGHTLRVGLIGTGNIGKTHLIGLASLKEAGLLDVTITALCDTDRPTLEATAGLFEVKNSYEDYNDLVQDENVDVVYICTPTSKHLDMVKAAAKAKKQVFCEKPLALSCPQAREMWAVTKDSSVCAGVGLVLRYDQFLLHARNVIAENDFGRPMLAHIRDDQRFPVDYIYYSKWRGEKSQAGGGTLIEHSIHDVDVLRWFYGDVQDVYARINYFSSQEVEDQASLVITHKNGAVSTLDSVWHYVDRPNERQMEFFFEKGYIGIRLESGKRYLEYQIEDQPPIRILQESADAALLAHLGLDAGNISHEAKEAITSVGPERYAALSYAFLTAIRNGKVICPDFSDAVAAHQIIDAAYESASGETAISLL